MKKSTILLSLALFCFSSFWLYADTGKRVFETYCWGCHHQTAVAFGPPFELIASKRSAQEIKAMITDPASVSKLFKYKRNAMPSFQLSDENLTAITKYILSYRLDENSSDTNVTQDNKKGDK